MTIDKVRVFVVVAGAAAFVVVVAIAAWSILMLRLELVLLPLSYRVTGGIVIASIASRLLHYKWNTIYDARFEFLHLWLFFNVNTVQCKIIYRFFNLG